MRVTAGNDFIEYYDVLIGEVWLAGGQSNMELELRNSENAEEALENCADPLLRFYNVPKTGVINRNAEHAASWQESSPENSGVMSAVAYYSRENCVMNSIPTFQSALSTVISEARRLVVG